MPNPFETLKLRMVNGTHSAQAYSGAAADWATMDQAMAQPDLRRYIDVLLRHEVAPTLPVARSERLPPAPAAALRPGRRAAGAGPAGARSPRRPSAGLPPEAESQAWTRHLAGFAPVFGHDLGTNPVFVDRVAHALVQLRRAGVAATLARQAD